MFEIFAGAAAVNVVTLLVIALWRRRAKRSLWRIRRHLENPNDQ
jgi:uncharacterized membrane protein YsdA (DUF1294 family)